MDKRRIKKFLKDNSIIIFDSSVWLDIYRLLPDDIYNTLTVINKPEIYNKLYLTYQVREEFDRNHYKVKAEHYALCEKVKKGLLEVIDKFEEKIIKSMEASKARYKLTDKTSRKKIVKKIGEIKKIANDYIKYNEAQNLLSNEKVAEKVEELINKVSRYRFIDCLTDEDKNEIAKEGEKRYADKVPPGYMDIEKTNGNIYGDLFIWKEIIKYAKANSINVLYVTNEDKEDWFTCKEGAKEFRNDLIDEFVNETGQQILGMQAPEFYDFAKHYYLSTNETLKDINSYIIQNFHKYLEFIDTDLYDYFNNILFNCDGGECEIYSPWDILSNYDGSYYEHDDITRLELINCNEISRYEGDVYLELEYEIEFAVKSAGYDGRDDDTREILLSPIRTHTLLGRIKFTLSTTTSEFIFPTDKFSVDIIEKAIKEISYDDGFNDDYYDNDDYDDSNDSD